jgi:hypothetical protein
MKLTFWILTVLTVFCWGMYDQVREVEREQISIPVAVAR